jgi:type IV secretory pathway VirJ component
VAPVIAAALLALLAAGSAPSDLSDLPLVESPAPGSDPRLAVLLTGDGGWAELDAQLASAFARMGVATVGLDSPQYFWKKRTPDEAARDVARAIAHYSRAWSRREVILVGYSRGADIVPIVAGRLPPEARSALRLVAMLGPGTFAELEFHAIDLLRSVRRRSALPTEDAVRATGGATRMLCVQGSDEKDSLCPHLVDLAWVKRVVLPGGHHFDKRYGDLARLILDSAEGEADHSPSPRIR